jgi:hypothetical protein
MANYIKSFNFRNGVQVDNNRFIVNANGLVGIGSTIPTQVLDVVGNINVSGFVTAPNLYTTLLSAPAASITTVTAGVVTANYFYGDGQNIINIPTSQWTNINVGLGFTSIYARGYVGIATVDPRFTLQVGGNPNNSQSGVGINSTGSILATGIITASSFSGSGSSITNINASNINAGTLGNSYLPSSISVSGIITSSQYFSGNLVGNVLGNVSGFSGGLNGTPDITVSNIQASNYYSTGILTSTTINATSIVTTSINLTSLNVGTSGTVFNVVSSGGVGIGTSLPTSDLQIRKSSGSLLEVISDSEQSRISVGQSVGVGKSTAVLRFGNTSKTFDIINNDTGNINTIIHGGPSGVGTGRFAWLYGQTNAELASLTYDGKLGLGITNPSNTLHVVGTSTVTSTAYFGSNVNVNGTLTAGTLTAGNIILPAIITNTNLNNNTGVTTVANLYVSPTGIGSIGISTNNAIAGLDARSVNGLFGRIGVNTSSFYGAEVLNVYGTGLFLGVGIGTTSLFTDSDGTFGQAQIHNSSLRLYGSIFKISQNSSVGFNTSVPRSIMDFGRVSTATTNPYIILPNVPTATITGLGNTIEGAIIYNSTTKKHQGYGSSDGGSTFKWIDLY